MPPFLTLPTPILDSIRTLESAHAVAVYANGSTEMVWLMEPRLWSELLRELVETSYAFVYPGVATILGWSVVMVPKMTGVTLHDAERAVSFSSTAGRIDGHIDWLALLKSGARAIA